MKRISVSPRAPAAAYLRRARAHLKRDGAVVLVGRGNRAHRHLREIYKAFRLDSAINPRIFVEQVTNEWHLLLASSETHVHLNANGVPGTNRVP